MSADPRGTRRVVLATGNSGKMRELTALLMPHGLDLILQSRLCIAPVAETGATLEANALLKARNAASASGLAALADDSGLEVDSLGGRPGVHSARYAGQHATDEQNNALLLSELAGKSGPQRAARYRCVIVFLRGADDAAPLIASGTWEGRIAAAPRGEGGFGYDPLFIARGFTCTVAQMSQAEKNTVSHRAKALRQLVHMLTSRG
ncbi:MAG: RdgB/HAM1 family non-canonical purine NTP pyrophosphatase [Pseudomonadota bacterium]